MNIRKITLIGIVLMMTGDTNTPIRSDSPISKTVKSISTEPSNNPNLLI